MCHLIREKGVSTEPPPSENYGGSITQWEIFDSYKAEYLKEKNKKNDLERPED
jgi:dynein intermediate chain 1